MEMGSTALRVPLATYRVQLGPHLSFEQLTGLLSYFHDLGISHLYLSPCLRAAAGSTHGYDVVDPAEVNPELGGR
jgi:(1->4)-alpha-D-glucan 1-alpha-D-glucosylmutase